VVNPRLAPLDQLREFRGGLGHVFVKDHANGSHEHATFGGNGNALTVDDDQFGLLIVSELRQFIGKIVNEINAVSLVSGERGCDLTQTQ
jgi:hypothetical protein